MSQLAKSKGGKASKRKTGAAAAQSQGSIAADDRTVRQRTEQGSIVRSSAGGGPAAAAAASAAAVTLVASAFMRLAVVERQLVMQLLDIKSLAKLASTCKQMRTEAMHKEAGKFLRLPEWNTPDGYNCSIEIELDPDVKESRPAHLSPLFRKHMPTLLQLSIPEAGEALELSMVEPLLRKADKFSRIVEIIIPSEGAWEGDIIWPQSRMLALLSRPCIQRVEKIHLGAMSWLKHPRVQAALFALPCLAHITIPEPPPRLLKTALSQAHALTTLILTTVPERARDFHAIRQAPSLTKLWLENEDPAKVEAGASFAEVVWSLPSTLEHLSLRWFDVREAAASRALLKAMMLRVPSLKTLNASDMETAPILRALLDAGVKSLSKLEHVSLTQFRGTIDPAPLRRFLHRFPVVTVRLTLPYSSVPSEADKAFGRKFGGWPRVELDETPAENDGPPVADKDDDVDGPSVEAAVDPGSDEEK